jgi:hypothetical protein
MLEAKPAIAFRVEQTGCERGFDEIIRHGEVLRPVVLFSDRDITNENVSRRAVQPTVSDY